MMHAEGGRVQAPGDDDRPDDLFDTLETLPLPESGSADELAAEAPEEASSPPPVGYCSPPVHTRWQKNGPSPNPRGRPPKRERPGLLSGKMRQELEIELLGRTELMTKRAALDRMVRDKAFKVGGGWLKLWEARQARDRALQQRIDDYEREKAGRSSNWETQRRIEQQQGNGDALLTLMEEVAPGLLATQRKLEQMGMIERPPT